MNAGQGRLLVVNADDFGLTPGVSEGILQAHERGIVTSTSVLVVAPAFDRHAGALRDSGLAAGLHLCAVGEDPPMLSSAEVPTLVDRHGSFPLTWRAFCARALSSRIDPDDLRREFAAQAGAAADAGLEIGHLDAHQNLHLWPSFGRVLVDLATERSIPTVRVPATLRWTPTALGVRTLRTRLRHRALAAGRRVPDHAAGLDTAGHLGGDQLVRTIESIDAGYRSVDLTVHPGLPHDPDRGRYRWGYEWAAELSSLCGASASAAVATAGFRLGTFADLPGDASSR